MRDFIMDEDALKAMLRKEILEIQDFSRLDLLLRPGDTYELVFRFTWNGEQPIDIEVSETKTVNRSFKS